MSKLAIVVSHPIQYYSPLFVELAKEIDLKVFYAFKPNAAQQGKDGFGKAFEWDIDLLAGYPYQFVPNISSQPSSSNYQGCDTPTIGNEIKNFEATHVVTFGWYLKMHRQALQYCKKNKIPIAVRGDSQLNPLLPFWKRIIKNVYYPYFLKQYDAFLSVGARNREYLTHYGIPEKKIIFSPHAVDQDFWRIENRQAQTKYVFIWVAKFIHKKRPLDVINAFKWIIENEPSLTERVELRMVGSGELLENAKEEAKDCKQIHFLGFKNQQELKKEYASANCLVLTSDYGETWGLVVNEAFAASLPAIVSGACGCSPDLINNSTGLVYQMGDPKSLSKAMIQMVENGNSAGFIQIQKSGLTEINRLYSFESNLESFKNFESRF